MRNAQQDAYVFYSTRVFRVLLDSLARPGKVNQLEYPHFLKEIPADAVGTRINFFALGALLSLLDRETSFILAAQNAWLPQESALAQWITLSSGAHVALPDQAAFALVCDRESGGLTKELYPGSFLEPENSATAIYCLERIAQNSDDLAGTTNTCTLELRGPGIEEKQIVHLQGLDEATLLATRHRYPLGIDVYLIDSAGRCIGLPRSTYVLVERGG